MSTPACLIIEVTLQMQIHLINKFENRYGGSELRTLELAKLLRPYGRVSLWSEYDCKDDFYKVNDIKIIQPKKLIFPKIGIFIFVGTYYWVGDWLRFSFANRIIVINNMPSMYHFDSFMARLVNIGGRCPLMVGHASEWLKKESNVPGEVLMSPIDLEEFKPGLLEKKRTRFTVGRYSRDELSKHNLDDIGLYKSLEDAGVSIKIMGGLVLKPYVSELKKYHFMKQAV